jgi:hypothetical protein
MEMFSGCSSLDNITIPDSVTSVSAFAFSACTSLRSIDLPFSVTSIGSMAFSGCSNLNSITIRNPQCSIDSEKITICNSYSTGRNGVISGITFNGTIYGPDNSTAKAYANKHGYNFATIGSPQPQPTTTTTTTTRPTTTTTTTTTTRPTTTTTTSTTKPEETGVQKDFSVTPKTVTAKPGETVEVECYVNAGNHKVGQYIVRIDKEDLPQGITYTLEDPLCYAVDAKGNFEYELLGDTYYCSTLSSGDPTPVNEDEPVIVLSFKIPENAVPGEYEWNFSRFHVVEDGFNKLEFNATINPGKIIIEGGNATTESSATSTTTTSSTTTTTTSTTTTRRTAPILRARAPSTTSRLASTRTSTATLPALRMVP